MRHGPLAILGLCIAVLSSCYTTQIAITDESFGLERIVGQRSIHLQTQRTRIEAIEKRLAPPAGDRTLSVGFPDDASTSDMSYYRFFLSFLLENRGDRPWELETTAFEGRCTRVVHTADTTPEIVACPARRTLVTVAGQSSAQLRIPVFIAVPESRKLRDLEQFLMTIRINEGDQRLLERRFLIGAFSQPSQLARLAVAFTTGLVVLAAL